MKGQSIIELLIAIGFFIIFFSGVVFLIFDEYASGRLAQEMSIANFLASEGIEAAITIRDGSWDALAVGEHGLATSAESWVFQGEEENIDFYLNEGKRKLIVESLDSNRKKITSRINWSFSKARPQEIRLVTYLTGWHSLTGGWLNPFQESFLDLEGDQYGLKIQTKNDYAYMISLSKTGPGGNSDFSIIDVSDTANPFLVSSLDIPNDPRNISISENYAYISSSNNDQELQIIDLSDPFLPDILGVYNAPGNADANGMAARWPLVYLLRNSSPEDEFLILDVSNPSSIRLLASLDLRDNANELVILGNYVFIASDHNNQELQVVDISYSSFPWRPSLVGFFDLPGNSNALTIDGFGNIVLLGRADGFLHIFDVSLPAFPVLLSSFNAGGAINDISLDNENRYVFLGTESNAAEFQVIDISNLNSPVLLGSFDLLPNFDIMGLAYNELKDRVFCALKSASPEFIIIAP